MSIFLAVGALLAAITLLLVPGGILFAPFAFGASLLALVAVIGGSSDRTVRQHNPAMNPRGWRDGS